jgi:hypothetical protein
MTKHSSSHDYPRFRINSSRSEIIALRRVGRERGNRVLSSLILDPNSHGLKQASLARLALSAWESVGPGGERGLTCDATRSRVTVSTP